MPPDSVVFLFDVDNILLDNDRVTLDLKRYLEKEAGSERNKCYWSIFEALRSELGYADYLGALQRYRIEYPYDSHLLMVSTYLVNYPFANRLYPNSLDVIEHCQQWGRWSFSRMEMLSFNPERLSVPVSWKPWRGTF